MDFFLFIVLNIVLLVRPSEIVQAVAAWPIYQVVILGALAVCYTPILVQLQWPHLRRRPITVCVVGLLVAVVMSHLSHFFIWGARVYGMEFLKVVLYYLLLISVINSTARLHKFLLWVGVLAIVLTTLALLQFHGFIDIPALAQLNQREFDPNSGTWSILPRLRSTGIYNDPNDLSMIIVAGMGVAAYVLSDRSAGVLRFVWLVPLGMFGYALAMTRSRGGFLALLAGLLAMMYSRWGGRRTAIAGIVAVPLMFVLFAGGRQTDLGGGVSEGTGQSRIQLWSEGLGLFRQAPLFGIGYKEFYEEVGQVAHNSFVHSFTELGLFGGGLFLGAVFLSVTTMWKLGQPEFHELDPRLRRMRPFLFAIVTSYATAMLTLSRAYVVPTYLIIGLAAAYMNLATTYPPLPVVRFDGRLVQRLAVLSVAFVAATYVFVRVFVRWS